MIFSKCYTKNLDTDIFQDIEVELSTFSSEGNVLLNGDFNAKTNNFPDYVGDSPNRFCPATNDILYEPSFWSILEWITTPHMFVAASHVTISSILPGSCDSEGTNDRGTDTSLAWWIHKKNLLFLLNLNELIIIENFCVEPHWD